jgi:hypothetical protein
MGESVPEVSTSRAGAGGSTLGSGADVCEAANLAEGEDGYTTWLMP